MPTLKITLKDFFVLFIHFILNRSISVEKEAQDRIQCYFAGCWLQMVADPDYPHTLLLFLAEGKQHLNLKTFGKFAVVSMSDSFSKQTGGRLLLE